VGLPRWCYTLDDQVFEWLMQLQDEAHPGRFRFCRTGSVFMPAAQSGLDASALTLQKGWMFWTTLIRFPGECW